MAHSRIHTITAAEAKRLWRSQEGKKLAAQVVAQEPLCRLQLIGCTQVSEQADHIIPISTAPALWNARTNLQGTCAWCNNHRQNSPIEDYDEPAALSYFDVC